MVTLETAAHGIGLVGEACNFYGAYILARDVLNREEEHQEHEELEEFSKWIQHIKVRLKAIDVDLTTPGAAALVLVRRAVLVGQRGFRWLKFGFACLALYHTLALLHGL
jgi:Flp pilus assembly protein TadB